MSVGSNDVAAVFDAFFDAIERGDIERVSDLYSDDIEVWHNVTNSILDKAASLDLLRAWCRRVDDRQYDVVERAEIPTGALQRHILRGTCDDTRLAVPVCIVVHLEAGRIRRIFEYLDANAVAVVFPSDRPAGGPSS